MNLAQLRKQLGRALRIRPIPDTVISDGTGRVPTDGSWILEEIRDSPARIRLRRSESNHSVEIHSDSVREFRHPDVLALKAQLVLSGPNVEIEHEFGPHLAPTPSDLEEVLEKRSAVPLLARDAYIESIIGAVVECHGRLGSLKRSDGERYRMGLILKKHDVFFEVDRSKYPDIGVISGDERIRAVGKIASVGITVELAGVSFVVVQEE